jgi:hypothetical protein
MYAERFIKTLTNISRPHSATQSCTGRTPLLYFQNDFHCILEACQAPKSNSIVQSPCGAQLSSQQTGDSQALQGTTGQESVLHCQGQLSETCHARGGKMPVDTILYLVLFRASTPSCLVRCSCATTFEFLRWALNHCQTKACTLSDCVEHEWNGL